MVIIVGVQFGKEHRYIDYPVMNVVQTVGRAFRPMVEDERSRSFLMCQQTRKDFDKKGFQSSHISRPISSMTTSSRRSQSKL